MTSLTRRTNRSNSYRPNWHIEQLEPRCMLSANGGSSDVFNYTPSGICVPHLDGFLGPPMAVARENNNGNTQDIPDLHYDAALGAPVLVVPGGDVTETTDTAEVDYADKGDTQGDDAASPIKAAGNSENIATFAVTPADAQPVEGANDDGMVVMATIRAMAPENSGAESPGNLPGFDLSTMVDEAAPAIKIAATDDASASDGSPASEKAAPDDVSSQPQKEPINENEPTLKLLNAGPQDSTNDQTVTGSPDEPDPDATRPIVYNFGGTMGSTAEGGSEDPAPLHPVDGSTDDGSSDTPVTAPIMYTLGGNESNGNRPAIDLASSSNQSALRRKDVKHIAREIKRGHDVNLDVAALVQLHSTAKKDTRKMIERIIVTVHDTNHSSTGPAAPGSNVEAVDQAFAGLGGASLKVKALKRRH